MFMRRRDLLIIQSCFKRLAGPGSAAPHLPARHSRTRDSTASPRSLPCGGAAGTARHDVTWHDMTRHGTTRHDTTRHDTPGPSGLTQKALWRCSQRRRAQGARTHEHVSTAPRAIRFVSLTLKNERRYQLFKILDCQNICE